MGSIVGVVVAVLGGIAVAGSSVLGLVETQTAMPDAVSEPLVVYGTR